MLHSVYGEANSKPELERTILRLLVIDFCKNYRILYRLTSAKLC